MFKHSPNGKGMVLWNIVFPRGNRHVKEKKSCPIKDTMSVKISFTHYRNYIPGRRVKLPVDFSEFDWFMFFGSFFFSLLLSISKRSTLAKNWGAAAPAPLPPSALPVSTGLETFYHFQRSRNVLEPLKCS